MSKRRSSPSGLFGRAEDKVKLSDDVIEGEFTSPPDSRLLDFSPIRLGSAKTAREWPKSPDESPLAVPKKRSVVHPPEQRNAFRRRDARLQSRLCGRANQSRSRSPNSNRL